MFAAGLRGRFHQLGAKVKPLPRKLRKHRAPTDRATTTAAPRVDPLARLLLAGGAGATFLAAGANPMPFSKNAPGWTTRSVVDTSSSTGTTRVATLEYAQPGATATMTGTAHIPKGADGKDDHSRSTMDYEIEIAKKGGPGKSSYTFSGGVDNRLQTNGPCPTADGKLNMTLDDRFSMRSNEAGVQTGVEYIRKSTQTSVKGTFAATVNSDAKLESIKFDITSSAETSYAASFLRGLIRNTWSVKVTARGTGSINGQSGAVSTQSLVVDSTGRALGLSKSEANAAFGRQLPGSSGLYEQEIANYASQGYKQLKEAEKHWQEPNACAKITFSPASGASLGSGETLGVDGTVSSKRDSAESTGKWPSPTIRHGSLASSWPGASAPGSPLRFMAKGAPPNDAGSTFDMRARATSRAGIAEADWTGKSSGWKVTVTGQASALQAPCCYTISGPVSTTVLVLADRGSYVGEAPWAYGPIAVTGSHECSYRLDSIAGTTNMWIEPVAGPGEPKIKLTMTLADQSLYTLTCPSTGSAQLGWALIGGYVGATQQPSAVFTVPAATPSDSPLTWSSPPGSIAPASGSLNVHVEPA